MTTPIRTAIFPVAGLGTRFLPATKATPKELLPVIDTPLIQFAIDEARDAGMERMVFVSHPSKAAIERHIMDDRQLRTELDARGKSQIATELEDAALSAVADDVVFTMQDQPLGLGHAVLCARDHVLPGPVAVILPDDLILGTNCLKEMICAYDRSGTGHLVATMRVSPEEAHRYGILSVTSEEGTLLRAHGMVEKPKAGDAPSRDAVVGRYVLDPSIFDALATQPPGSGDEIQLTDAITRGAGNVGLTGLRFSGKRFDCGSKSGMLRAILHLAAQDPEYADVVEEWTATVSAKLAA